MEQHPQIGVAYDCLTAIQFTQSVGSKHYWLCRCSCGNEREVDEARLAPGVRNWCRCAQIAATRAKSTKHGFTSGRRKHPLYLVWRSMRSRCENPKVKRYPDYGGRGIQVCERWRIGDGDKTGFECFIADMGEKPSPQHTLERVQNNDPYSPQNCIWATRKTQSVNRRNVYRIEVGGRAMTLREAADHHGITMSTVQTRLRCGWPLEDALTKPVDFRKGAHKRVQKINNLDRQRLEIEARG